MSLHETDKVGTRGLRSSGDPCSVSITQSRNTHRLLDSLPEETESLLDQLQNVSVSENICMHLRLA